MPICISVLTDVLANHFILAKIDFIAQTSYMSSQN